MQLTKNEKKTLKLLIENARITDSEIANKLTISSQAVGKIRRKLESQVIKKYSVELDYHKLGIQTFAVAIGKITSAGLSKGGLEVDELIHNNPNIITAYRIPRGNSTHMMVFGFEELSDLDSFFQSATMHQELHQFLEVHELYTFSHNSMIKNSSSQLFHNTIEKSQSKMSKRKFSELETYKERLFNRDRIK